MSEFKVPKGWKLVPEEPTPQMLDEIHLVSEFTGKALTTRYRAMLAAAPAAPTADGTTSDKYRAELYDEVWQRARDMGYGNVTDALVELERLKAAAPVVQEWPVVMPTDAQLIEIARRLGALPELCYAVDRPDIRWRANPEVRAMVREVLTLYAAPPAHPDAALVEALKELVSAVRSINRSRRHQIRLPVDSKPVYWQRKEWIDRILGLADSADAAMAAKEASQ